MKSLGFPPIASVNARVLILGSLPGRLSLERGEYYANPRNAFWRIVASRVPDFPTEYAARAAVLVDHQIALWDVLAAATRSGSLDARIQPDVVPNDFRAFFEAHPHVRLIAFNGSKASLLYERFVLPILSETHRTIARQTLPSTSGAHAKLTHAQKAARWSVIWDAGGT